MNAEEITLLTLLHRRMALAWITPDNDLLRVTAVEDRQCGENKVPCVILQNNLYIPLYNCFIHDFVTLTRLGL